MSTKLDLKQLAIDRSGAASKPQRGKRRRQHWFSRYVVPVGVLLGFVILIGAAIGRRLLPVPAVRVLPVITKRADVQRAGQPIFQAPGWVEPRPTPISVPALAAGVIESLQVVEGQSVAQGDTIANLIPIDAQLAVERAESALAIRQGEHKRAVAEHEAAKLRVERPVHLEVLIADAENELASATADLQQLPFLIESAEAELGFAQESAAGKQAAGDGVSEVIRQRATADLRAATARLNELQNRQPNLLAQQRALERKVAALQEQRQLLIEEKRQLQEAEAKVETAAAIRDEASVQLQEAQLQLQRMSVKAPVSGRVLKLIASPGDRVSGAEASADQTSSTVVQMYDPARLQVRVDVRLEDVPLVVPGQQVEIQTAAANRTIVGKVLQPTSSANVQKNTLEVKVALIDPPPNVTPEMLVTATFLAPAQPDPPQEPVTNQQLFVPSDLIFVDGESSYVWIVDANQRVQKAAIEPGIKTNDGLTEVRSGLEVTDKLLAEPTDQLDVGDQVEISGDDTRIGMQSN